MDLAPGESAVVAGTGQPGATGNGGEASAARLSQPTDVAVDGDGAVYIADTGNHRLRRVAPNGTISTLAGSAEPRVAAGIGDNGPASRAVLRQPQAVAAGNDGNVYIGQPTRIRMVNQGGTISTVAGSGDRGGAGEQGFSGEGGRADAAAFSGVNGIDVADDGTLYIATEKRLLRVGGDGLLTTVADTGDTPDARPRAFGDTGDVVASDGGLYLVSGDSGPVRVDPRDGAMTVVGPSSGSGAAVDNDGNLYTADEARVTVLGQPDAPRAPSGPGEATGDQADAAVPAGGRGGWADEDPGTITTVAGSAGAEEQGSAGDGGPALDAQLNKPGALALDGRGNLYVADSGDDRVRAIVAAADAPGESAEGNEEGLTPWSAPWTTVVWSIAGIAAAALAALAVLVLRRPTETMISVVAWGIAGYTLLRERFDRIRGRGGSRSGEGDRAPGPDSEG